MRNLRTQLMLSHLVLVVLMVVVMAGGVATFFRLGRSIDGIFQRNYRSVLAAQAMQEALERQDSAVAFFLSGQVAAGRRMYQTHWPRFDEAYRIEASNITEAGEKELANAIGARFAEYRKQVEGVLYASPPLTPAEAKSRYFGTIEPEFRELKRRAREVLELNQAAILRADRKAKEEARLASYASIGVTTGALLLALMLVPWTVRAALAPLRSLAQQAEEIGAGHLNQRIELNRTDEVGTLADAFSRMAAALREARQLEAERLQRAERMSDAALESLLDPVLVTDSVGRVVHLNPAAEQIFGAADMAAGRSIAQVVDEPRIALAVARAVEHEHVSDHEGEPGFVVLRVGGEERTFRMRASPMRDPEGDILGAAMVLEDITHLRELDRLKNEFIGVASHELRTPVTSLLLAVQLLEEGAVGELTPAQREVVAAQKDDLQRLERLMRDLLDITRLESGVKPPRLEVTTARELVDRAAEAVESMVRTKGVHLTIEHGGDLPPVNADRAQIVRVLVNLLNNAVRHTPDGGRVTVITAADGPAVRFTVRDTGPGIPPAYLTRVFDRFVQVPGATRGGAGLGLSIAQTVVRAHGGEIRAESEPGAGATFTFAIPAAG